MRELALRQAVLVLVVEPMEKGPREKGESSMNANQSPRFLGDPS